MHSARANKEHPAHKIEDTLHGSTNANIPSEKLCGALASRSSQLSMSHALKMNSNDCPEESLRFNIATLGFARKNDAQKHTASTAPKTQRTPSKKMGKRFPRDHRNSQWAEP